MGEKNCVPVFLLAEQSFCLKVAKNRFSRPRVWMSCASIILTVHKMSYRLESKGAVKLSEAFTCPPRHVLANGIKYSLVWFKYSQTIQWTVAWRRVMFHNIVFRMKHTQPVCSIYTWCCTCPRFADSWLIKMTMWTSLSRAPNVCVLRVRNTCAGSHSQRTMIHKWSIRST